MKKSASKRQGSGESGYGFHRDMMKGSGLHTEKTRKEKERQKLKKALKSGHVE